jgi:hypothetical protein
MTKEELKELLLEMQERIEELEIAKEEADRRILSLEAQQLQEI